MIDLKILITKNDELTNFFRVFSGEFFWELILFDMLDNKQTSFLILPHFTCECVKVKEKRKQNEIKMSDLH